MVMILTRSKIFLCKTEATVLLKWGKKGKSKSGALWQMCAAYSGISLEGCSLHVQHGWGYTQSSLKCVAQGRPSPLSWWAGCSGFLQLLPFRCLIPRGKAGWGDSLGRNVTTRHQAAKRESRHPGQPAPASPCPAARHVQGGHEESTGIQWICPTEIPSSGSWISPAWDYILNFSGPWRILVT